MEFSEIELCRAAAIHDKFAERVRDDIKSKVF